MHRYLRGLFTLVILLALAACGGGNEEPMADFVITPEGGTTETQFTFDASGSSDPDGDIVSYEWEFGDGETATGQTVQHTYAEPGTYNVTLTVTDDDGAEATETKEVVVESASPDAQFTVTPTGGSTETIFTFNASGSSDPDGEIVAYTWDFGDGSAPVTEDDPTTEHQFGAPGTYEVTLTVTDDDGATATTTQEVTVLDPATAGTVTGYVANRKAGTAVEGTTVRVEGTTLSATTDGNGFYSILAPEGFVTLTFNQEDYAESRVEGLRVEAGGETEYSTIQFEDYDPALPNEAPALDTSVANGDTLTGEETRDEEGLLVDERITFTISGATVNQEENGFYFVSAGLSNSRGNSGYLNASVPGESFDSITDPTFEEEVSVSSFGFDGETSLHIIGYDQNRNRTEVIRYVTVETNFSGGGTVNEVTELDPVAITFGDTSVFGTLSVTSDFDITELVEAMQKGDSEAFKEQARAVTPTSGNLQTQAFLDEVITWVDLTFVYEFDPATFSDIPTAFEIFRRLGDEEEFRSIGRVDAVAAYVGDLFAVENPADAEDPFLFLFRDATPGLQADLEATYRVEAVTGETRTSSETASVTPLSAFDVTADSPANSASGVPTSPTYEMTFIDRSDFIVYGVVVLDRLHAEGNFVEWLWLDGVILPDDTATTASVEHNVDGTATLEDLQPYHAYDWQPVAVTINADFNAFSIGADFFSLFGVTPFGVTDGPVNSFITGDGNE